MSTDGLEVRKMYKQGLRQTKRLSRQLPRKVEGSQAWKRACRVLAKHQATMAKRRRDHHYKLAHALCDAYTTMTFEDLNLAGMKAMWGCKVSDLGFASFLSILAWAAFKRGKRVLKIDRFTPTTQTCSNCGQKHHLTLHDRVLACACGLTIDRDHNAAINIQRAGASARYPSASQMRLTLRRRLDGRSSRL